MIKEFSQEANQARYPFILPELPYPNTALQPYITAETLEYHHGKHHKTYVDALNKLLQDGQMQQKSLEEVIIASENSQEGIFNNAAQVWNHSFYWHCMSAPHDSIPTNPLTSKIAADFGSMEQFTEEFKMCGMKQFGSGWVWLILNKGKLELTKTSNAQTPITKGFKPIFTCDVWEHAYYIDHRNKRVEYLDYFIKNLINWDFALKNFSAQN